MRKCNHNATWLRKVARHLRDSDLIGTPRQLGRRIHYALQIAEVEKQDAPGRFIFEFTGVTVEDIAEIRSCLTPFENSIVEIEREE